jgi:hypothetical protein
VGSTRRQRAVWIGISALYALLLLGAAIIFLLDPGLDTHDKLVGIGAVVGIPALAYGVALAPLWRESRSRVALAGGGAIALVTAVLIAIATFGVGFPLSVILVVVAIADAERALALSGVAGKSKLFVLLAAVAALGALVGLVLPLALLAAVAAVAFAVWKLATARRA